MIADPLARFAVSRVTICSGCDTPRGICRGWERAYGHGVQIGRGAVLSAVALACAAGTAGCGTSSTRAATTPSPTLAEAPTSEPERRAHPELHRTADACHHRDEPGHAAVSQGPKSASCVNGWVQPAPGADFFKQAQTALDASQGATGYVVKAVRYFAGPLPSGGIGAVYYLDVRDPRLTARVLLVSGAGPAGAAIAPTGTTGWKPGEWHAFKGTDPAAVTPFPGIPLPGKWKGPSYDPVAGATPLLSPSLVGCLDGT